MEEALCNWRRAVIINSFHQCVTYIDNKKRENMYTVVARKLGIPVDAIILYHKKKYVTSDTIFTSRTLFDDVDEITLHLAVKQSDNAEVMQLCISKYHLTCLCSIIVRDEAGIRLNEIFSLYDYTFVMDIMDKINGICEHKKFILNGRFLSPNDYLADLYFESGVLRQVIELKIHSITSHRASNENNVHLEYVSLKFLTSEVGVNIYKHELWTIKNLKYYVLKEHRIPARCQEMTHLGKAVMNHFSLRMLHSLEDPENRSNTIVITVVIKPSHKRIRLLCEYMQFPDNGFHNFSELATVREMKVIIGMMVGVAPDYLVLLDRHSCNNFVFDDDVMFHELTLTNSGNIPCLDVRRKITINVNNGSRTFDHFIQMSEHTIDHLKFHLNFFEELDESNERLSFIPDRDSRNNLMTKATRLVDTPDDCVVRFYTKPVRSCILL